MTSDVQVLVRRGPDIAEWFDAVAGLRASVFRSFPYLYEGDTEYEKHYLAMYARSADSLLVLALADDVVVGASTGLPLGDAEAGLPRAVRRSRNPDGDSVLLRRISPASGLPGPWPGPSLL